MTTEEYALLCLIFALFVADIGLIIWVWRTWK